MLQGRGNRSGDCQDLAFHKAEKKVGGAKVLSGWRVQLLSPPFSCDRTPLFLQRLSSFLTSGRAPKVRGEGEAPPLGCRTCDPGQSACPGSLVECSDWLRDWHVTKIDPMRVSPGNSAGILANNPVFSSGVAEQVRQKCQRCGRPSLPPRRGKAA